MNLLLLGSGGREHALAWALSASPLLSKLYCVPGNAGIAELAECVDLPLSDHAAIARLCARRKIDLVVVGPEAPLVAGIADDLAAHGFKVFGPSKAAAQLEGSKGFTKDLCRSLGIPIAAYDRCRTAAAAKDALERYGLPVVIKADGLASGKGVSIAETKQEAHGAIDACFGGAFGASGLEVVIEEFLVGEEASVFALVDGEHILALATAQDYKRVFDGDRGPNTGGMGALSPAPVMTPELNARVMDSFFRPTVRAMAGRGMPYKGVLFAGLTITSDGPKLIEYNARFGDPECQVLMMRLKSDLLPALLAVCDGVLQTFDLRWHDDTALAVAMAADGYPAAPRKGTEIKGLEAAASVPGVQIFHAGTRRDGGRLIADGGRVLNVAARGKTAAEARDRAYEAIDRIDWPGGFCRRDIGRRAIALEKGKT
ncbi:MAG: phosphoribosylamine--glycine ligase [Hyphomicrobiaceae bacterium]